MTLRHYHHHFVKLELLNSSAQGRSPSPQSENRQQSL